MKLFEPGRIGRLSLRNRIVMAPMGTGGLAEPDGRFSRREVDYYATRAKGGTGLIVTGVAFVDRDIEKPPNVPIVDNSKCIASLNELAEAVHDYGARIAVELTAGFGRVGSPVQPGGARAVAPSAMPCFWDSTVTAREMTTEEVERLVRAFEYSAEILSIAGIDAVWIHAHEGYLFDQFQTALWNKRTDKYGGDLEGRLRFAVEVIKAIRRGAGEDFSIIYRFGLTHYLEGGRKVEEGLEIARRIEAAGVDALEVDAGCYETHHWPHPTTYQPPGCMVDMAEMVKTVVKIPVITVGKLGYPELAERVLQEGKADFISIGRALIADPEWPNKVKEGMLEDIRPCLADSEGCSGRILTGKYISCTVNPSAGMEKEFALQLAAREKSVLVIGGGPGGMEAARVAALRGHKVNLWERSNVLGGALIPASIPDFKEDYWDLLKYLSTQLNKLGVTVELGKEGTQELVKEMNPEVAFIATGSTPIIPEIPGIEKGKVVTAIDLLVSRKDTGESVVVIGGGIVGCETALYLAQKGKKVTIVEILDSLVRGIFKRNRIYLIQLLNDANVEILTETMVLEIIDEGITIANKYGKRSTLKADNVVLAVGLKPNSKLIEVLTDSVPEVYAIGDCVEPRKIINAIWEGFRTARLV
ncbi:FAD-dependent oxidoreductase [Candidatus Omnitrophota bacterium]